MIEKIIVYRKPDWICIFCRSVSNQKWICYDLNMFIRKMKLTYCKFDRINHSLFLSLSNFYFYLLKSLMSYKLCTVPILVTYDEDVKEGRVTADHVQMFHYIVHTIHTSPS
jgi:hypothetical protein